MHETDAHGHVISSKCDFCRHELAEDRLMIEGHQGSLICTRCLTQAYTEVVILGISTPPGPDLKCTMCLEHRDQPHWDSPAADAAAVCLRCIKQSATMFEKDPESGWRRPTGGPAVDDGIE